MDHGHLVSVRPPRDFDHGTIHPLEPPDERQYCGQVSELVRFPLPKDTPANPPGTEHPGQFKPNDERRAWQANIKTNLRKIAVADPVLFRVCLFQQRAEGSEIASST
jgi:hypothetical protein